MINMIFNITNHTISDYLKSEYYQKIAPYIKGKGVLDVGCVDHDIDKAGGERLWNHFFIKSLSKNTVGIDIELNSLKKMQNMGYEVKMMNAEKISFRKKFDVIFAGELIEHLTNPGLFLQSAKNALKKDGIILLTTPNTYSLNRLVRVAQKLTNEPPANLDHTMYFTPQTIKTLAKKSGLKIIKIEYSFFPFNRESLIVKLNKIVCNLLGEKFKEQMIVVLK